MTTAANIIAQPKREVALTSCPTCRRAVGVYHNRTYQCSCGRGSFYPIPDKKIKWIPESEATLKLMFARNLSQYGLAPYRTREV